MSELKKQIVLLTGASGGLGQAIAVQLSAQNYKVYGTGRKKMTSEIFIPIQMDLTDANSISQAVRYVIEQEGKIDVLINNAGIGITGSIEETDLDAVRKVFETNLFGLMQLIQETLPYMRAQKKGKIINISSIAGYTGLPFRGIYAATKAAVMRLTEALSAEVKSFNISVVDIAPGDFVTKIAEGRIYTELSEDSSYYDDYKLALKMIDEEVAAGLMPEVLSKKLGRILQKNKVKLRYDIGIFMQRLTPYLVTCLSGRYFEKLIRKHYKMK